MNLQIFTPKLLLPLQSFLGVNSLLFLVTHFGENGLLKTLTAFFSNNFWTSTWRRAHSCNQLLSQLLEQPRSVASFAQFSYLLSKGETWEGNIEGSALWVQDLPPFTTFWPTSLPSPNEWILSSMTDTVETGDSLLLFSCFTTSLPTPSFIFPQEMKM